MNSYGQFCPLAQAAQLLNRCQFSTTTKESFSIVNHRSKLGWFYMTLGTLACGAGVAG